MRNEEEDEDDSKNTIYIMYIKGTSKPLTKNVTVSVNTHKKKTLQPNSKENTDPKLSVVMTSLAMNLNDEKEEEQE